MYQGLLHLHNIMRWVILILLVWNLVRLYGGQKSLQASKWLMISAHIMLLLGLYQYIAGPRGLDMIQKMGGEVMKSAENRFWTVEHISGMLLAIVFITIGHIRLKKTGNTRRTAIFYTVAFILIMLMIPWPFRGDGIGRPLFPGM